MKSFLLLLLLISKSLFAHEALQTNTHADVLKKAQELARIYSPQEVLVVYDIDNTLLKARQPLGSDQWFEWQSGAIKNNSPEASFKTFDELMDAQGDFFQLSKMDLTENNLSQIVNILKTSGHPMLLLTSRGPEFRNVTERELRRNNLWFSDMALMSGIANEFLEVPFKLNVSYMNGIFMTSGHHKGEALAYLLKKSRKTVKAIIFADDHERHTKRVYETFSTRNDLEVVTFRYGKEDATVAAFKTSAKDRVLQETKTLMDVAHTIFNR
jgi:hypothetical protein